MLAALLRAARILRRSGDPHPFVPGAMARSQFKAGSISGRYGQCACLHTAPGNSYTDHAPDCFTPMVLLELIETDR